MTFDSIMEIISNYGVWQVLVGFLLFIAFKIYVDKQREKDKKEQYDRDM